MLQHLKKQVCEANRNLVRDGLVVLTWGNVSAVDRRKGLMVIKPSGVPYRAMRPGQMVVVSLETGEVVEGKLKPSSDTPTHLELYRAFSKIGGIVHCHSPHATAWAQARCEIPPFGTTHADHFCGAVPCTRDLRKKELGIDYEKNTGRVIVERFRQLNPHHIPGVLVAGHGPFTWGSTVDEAVENSIALEHIARIAGETLLVNLSARPVRKSLLERHFFRKHGPGARYGQRRSISES
ncbi:MAG TPA: L-ribulose-5-phosphate 4-epimerase [Bacteroidetes bacterium]|nr:L-ribulose-5-phosphate 4-epimerase [Bacteroidota bacterium]